MDRDIIHRRSYLLLRNKGSDSIHHSCTLDIQFTVMKMAGEHQETRDIYAWSVNLEVLLIIEELENIAVQSANLELSEWHSCDSNEDAVKVSELDSKEGAA